MFDFLNYIFVFSGQTFRGSTSIGGYDLVHGVPVEEPLLEGLSSAIPLAGTRLSASALSAAVPRRKRIEGSLESQNLVCQQAEGVDNCLLVVVLSSGNLGAHVTGGSNFFGHLKGFVAVVTPIGLVGENPGDVEIKDLELPRHIESHVIGFEIAVDDRRRAVVKEVDA